MNFKSLREDKLKYSQEEMAQLLEVSVDDIRLWENNNEPNFIIIQRIAEKTGLDYNTICNYEKPKPTPLETENTWETADFTKKSLLDYVSDTLEKMKVSEDVRKHYIEDLRIGIQKNLVKPSIAIVGRSDTGKSTLINSLLGADKMPTSWTPTTAIAVYIKHLNERPAFINDDVWVFASQIGKETIWDVKRLYDEEYCKQWKIAQGKVEILRDFGTRQGDKYSTHAGSAVIFVDAPILQDCDIVDLPGFGTETESDDILTMEVAQKTDVLIYLSQANGFMRIEDITYLKENVRGLPVLENKKENSLKPLCNLFIVASQAHTIEMGNARELTNILKTGCENFSKTLSKEYWTAREYTSGYSRIGTDYLPTRFFTYTTDIPQLCKSFNSNLKAVLEQLPIIINERAKAFVREYVKSRKPNLESEIKKYELLITEREKYVKTLAEIKKNELNRRRANDERKNEIRELITSLAIESRDEFSTYCSSTINVDALKEKIKGKKIKNKKEDVECFVSQLQDEIQNKYSEIVEAKEVRLADATRQYIDQYSESVKIAFEKSSLNVDFDAAFTFAQNLANAGFIGGLATYVAGQAAIWLGSIGFLAGIGGKLALSALWVGPIGAAISLALLGALGLLKLFGGGWEKTVAKKIVKAYDENNVVAQYRTKMTEYWEQTENAFNSAATALDTQWDEYVEKLENTINNYDVNQINANIAELRGIEHFFDNIPL